MEVLLNLLIPLIQNNWYEAVSTILALGFMAKYVAIRAAGKEFFNFVREVEVSKRDHVIDAAEYERIGRAAVPFAERVWGVIVGLFPNRSKV